jgi:putative peptidoglycan lipid II flippase
MVNTNLASMVADPLRGLDGPVSWLSYAFRFMQLPLGLFGVAMASATLPSISRSVAAGRMDEFRKTLSQSLGVVFLLTLPSSVGLWVLGRSIIGAIYQGGKFQNYDTQQTALALSCYAIGLTGYAALKVVVPAFYALGDSRLPMLVSLVSIGINVGAAVVLTRIAHLGIAGLALSTSAVALFGFLVLFELLRRRIGGVHGKVLGAQFLKIAMASVGLAAVVALSSHVVESSMGITRLAHLVNLVVSIPLGLGVYYGACRAFHVSDLDMTVLAFAAPVRRIFRSRTKTF